MVNEIIKIAIEKPQDTLLYNVIKDFVFPLLLTIISGIVAWFLFIKQLLIDKEKEKQSIKDDIENKLTYFAMLINNAIENSIGQNEFIKRLTIEIENSGFNFVPLDKYPIYDLRIIAEKLDKETYLLSYLKFYNNENKKNTLQFFKQIINSCGTINETFTDIHKILESKQIFEHELKTNFHNKLSDCGEYLGKSLVKLKSDNNPLFYKLFEISNALENLNNFKEDEIIKAQHNLFLKPTLSLLDKCHSEHMESDENVGNLWVTTSDAINILDNLESETIRLNEILKERHLFINNLIEILKKSSEKLRNDFFNDDRDNN